MRLSGPHLSIGIAPYTLILGLKHSFEPCFIVEIIRFMLTIRKWTVAFELACVKQSASVHPEPGSNSL